MRKLVIGMALASTALASPALARDDTWYVEVDGGAMILEDTKFDIGAVNNGASQDYDYGYDFGGIVGYDFGAFRLEAEASYREADPDSLTSVVRIPGRLPLSNPLAGATGSFNGVRGDANALSFMLNGLLDFGDDDGLQGFIGGGAGVARVDIHSSIDSTGPGFLNDTDSGFAWQALAASKCHPVSVCVSQENRHALHPAPARRRTRGRLR